MAEEKEIFELTLKEAWKKFLLYKDNIVGSQQIYTAARYGIHIKFDIYDYFYGNQNIKPDGWMNFWKSPYVKVQTFYTEIEEREELLKQALLSLEDDELFTHYQDALSKKKETIKQ